MNLYDQVWQIPGYCANGLDRAREVLPTIIDADPGRVLDIGCGHGHVVAELRRHAITAVGVDPFLPGQPQHCLRGQFWDISEAGAEVDVITCFDVLEHIEQDQVNYDLERMRLMSFRACFAIANMPDVHDVPGVGPVDLHLIKQPPSWWERMIRQHWREAHIQTLHYPERFFIWAGPWPSVPESC
jgi:SAM-dependent methyltransferase